MANYGDVMKRELEDSARLLKQYPGSTEYDIARLKAYEREVTDPNSPIQKAVREDQIRYMLGNYMFQHNRPEEERRRVAVQLLNPNRKNLPTGWNEGLGTMPPEAISPISEIAQNAFAGKQRTMPYPEIIPPLNIPNRQLGYSSGGLTPSTAESPGGGGGFWNAIKQEFSTENLSNPGVVSFLGTLGAAIAGGPGTIGGELGKHAQLMARTQAYTDLLNSLTTGGGTPDALTMSALTPEDVTAATQIARETQEANNEKRKFDNEKRKFDLEIAEREFELQEKREAVSREKKASEGMAEGGVTREKLAKYAADIHDFPSAYEYGKPEEPSPFKITNIQRQWKLEDDEAIKQANYLSVMPDQIANRMEQLSNQRILDLAAAKTDKKRKEIEDNYMVGKGYLDMKQRGIDYATMYQSKLYSVPEGLSEEDYIRFGELVYDYEQRMKNQGINITFEQLTADDKPKATAVIMSIIGAEKKENQLGR